MGWRYLVGSNQHRGPSQPLSVGEGVLYPHSDGLGWGARLLMVTGKCQSLFSSCFPPIIAHVRTSLGLVLPHKVTREQPQGPSQPLSNGEVALYPPSDIYGPG